MGRWMIPLLAVWGVLLPTTAASSPSKSTANPLDDGSPPPAQCVEASQDQHESRDDTLIIKLENGCTVPVHCTISWVVECKDGVKHASSRSASIAAGANRSLEASASACSEPGWRITPPVWSCSSK
jgi:hypothetical protein